MGPSNGDRRPLFGCAFEEGLFYFCIQSPDQSRRQQQNDMKLQKMQSSSGWGAKGGRRRLKMEEDKEFGE